MLNDPKERIEKRCPGCQFWGKGHVIDVVTEQKVCTGQLMALSKMNELVEQVQRSDESRVLPWRGCTELYQPLGAKGFFSRLFGKNKATKRYCIVCGKRIQPGTFGTFCDLRCATKYMDDEERKDKDEQSDRDMER